MSTLSLVVFFLYVSSVSLNGQQSKQQRRSSSSSNLAIVAPPPILREKRDNNKEDFEISTRVGKFSNSTIGELMMHKTKENIFREKDDEEEFHIQYNNLIMKSQIGECMLVHNLVRERFNLRPLLWNFDLSYSAQEWALILAERGKGVAHDRRENTNRPYFGENIYSSTDSFLENCRESVFAWYE